MSISEIDFSKSADGLIPAVAQDSVSGEVLMVAFANLEAFETSKRTGKACFYSRSRKSLWIKGESSGNFLEIVEIFLDCDNDCLLYIVKPSGPACHTGRKSCFYKKLTPGGFLSPD